MKKFMGCLMIFCMLCPLLTAQGWKTDESEKYLKWWDKKYQGTDSAVLGGVYYQKGEYENAIVTLKESVNTGTNDPRVYYRLGFCYDQIDNAEMAEQYYIKSIQLFEEQNPEHRYNFYAMYNIAVLYKEKGDIQEALKWANKAVDHSPNRAEGYNILGYLLAENDDFKGAIRNYEYSLKIFPEQEEALYNIAILYHIDGQAQKAELYFEKVLAIAPGNEKAQMYLKYLRGDTDTLDSQLVKLVVPNPSLKHCYLAQEAFKKGDIEKAKQEYELAAEVKSDSVIAHFGLGIVYEYNEEGKRYGKGYYPEKSVFHYNKALELNPYLVDAMFNLAVLYHKIGDDYNAKRMYLRILRIYPGDARVHYNLAVLYDNWLENPKKARYHYKKYLKLEPDSDKKDEINTRLERLRRYM